MSSYRMLYLYVKYKKNKNEIKDELSFMDLITEFEDERELLFKYENNVKDIFIDELINLLDDLKGQGLIECATLEIYDLSEPEDIIKI